MKREHEAACACTVRNGSSAEITTGLLAVGPDVVCTGDLTHIDAGSWTLRLRNFLIGDMHRIISFIDGFAEAAPENRYILSNELGDGRVLIAAPNLTKQADGYSLLCPVAPGALRVDAQEIGNGLAAHPETNDLHLDEKGNIARVSGVDYLPQRIREVLSMQRGKSVLPDLWDALLRVFRGISRITVARSALKTRCRPPSLHPIQRWTHGADAYAVAMCEAGPHRQFAGGHPHEKPASCSRRF